MVFTENLVPAAMELKVTVDLMQVLLGLLILAGAVFLVYLIVLMAKLIKTVGQVSKLVDEIDQPVADTLVQLPDLLKKVDKIADDLTVLTENINETVPDVLHDVQTISGTVTAGVEAVGGAAASIGDNVSSFFSKRSDLAGTIGIITQVAAQVASVIGMFKGRKKSGGVFGRRKSRRKK